MKAGVVINIFEDKIKALNKQLPCICVPFMPKDNIEAKQMMNAFNSIKIDILEWRIDYLTNITKENFERIAILIRTYLAHEVLLLVTLRTKCDGGNFNNNDQVYLEMINIFAQSELVDGIDIEYQYISDMLVDSIQANSKFVVCSYHDFNCVPQFKELIELLQLMAQSGASLIKIACMAHNQEDVMRIIELCLLKKDYPFCAIAMGECGKITRLGSMYLNNALCFVSHGKSSAPGQITYDQYYDLIKRVNR